MSVDMVGWILFSPLGTTYPARGIGDFLVGIREGTLYDRDAYLRDNTSLISELDRCGI
jgi:hypothetical protein